MTGNKQLIELPHTADRVRTGVPGLDEILGGGLLRHRVALLKGGPGTGKTTLALQMLVNGATQYDEPGLLLTFEQVPSQLFADAAALGWDLKRLHDENRVRVMFIEPDEVLDNPGRQANRLLVNIAELAEDHGARRIVIDSLSHLGSILSKDEARASFIKFMLELKALGLTPIGTAEHLPEAGVSSIDAYLVDTFILLDRQADRRTLEVVKSRGHRHIGGRHPFEINGAGVTVYPHSYPEPADGNAGAAPAPAAPLSSGVEGLDEMLGGGYTPGSTILLAGLSGTFKSVLAAHFLTSGEKGSGLWIGFRESAADLARDFAGHGLAFADAGIEVLEGLPGQDPVQKILAAADELITARGIGRVAIDSLNDLTTGLAGEERAEAVRWFLRRLRARGVTALMTQRLARVTGRNPLSEIDNAELADTIVYLGLVEIESRLEKVISVLKHRGGPAAGDLRSIQATGGGLVVSDRFLGISGVLGGVALGHRKAQIEEIFQPLYFIRDFLKMAGDPGLGAEQRAQMLGNMGTETDRVIGLLGRYFDQPQSAGKEARR
ncbi:MAG: ATPase domain-containing protein [Candidatus Sumerlaeia bacterium]